MKRIFTEHEVAIAPRRRSWTAVVPAAGRGSRLGHDQPKVLYPVGGRPILAWLIDLLAPRCEKVVLVVSPAGKEPIRAALGQRSGIELVEQSAPRGMGDAVACAEACVDTTDLLVVWGDQVTLRGETLDRLQSLHESRPDARLTLPTILREQPYIHVARDDEQRITRVYQRRDEAIPVAVGENDCGVFAFAARELFAQLSAARAAHASGELNLLPLLPRFEQGPGTVATFRVNDPTETLGVNTEDEARVAARVLAERGAV